MAEGVRPPVDVQAVPRAPVLLEEEDRRARRTGARPQAGGLELHQRHEAVDLGLFAA